MRYLAFLFLAGCFGQDIQAISPQGVPYPDAQGLGTNAAVCPSPDSDCFGAIKISQPFRSGTWTLGASLGAKFESLLVFNTKEDALKCLGTSHDFQVRVWRNEQWVIK